MLDKNKDRMWVMTAGIITLAIVLYIANQTSETIINWGISQLVSSIEGMM